MGNIVLLDDLTINKIAAGEVIERPASVIKEMIENSIDAGATNITVEIKNGGISYIKITDDGKGIAQDDLEIAFERHATSKIRSADDLDTVTSMGFRGEALASIAAIANVELTSKTKEQDIGYKIVVEAGNVLEKEEAGCRTGTTIIVRNLFFNTPVRYKFLKKDYTESGYIEDVITRIALVNPNIAIKLINTGKTVIQTNGNGDLKSVIYSIYGKDISNGIMEVSYQYEDIKITGVIGKPEIARSNRSNQLFFVNKRYIKDKTLTAATEQAYKGLIPIGKFGFVVLNLEMSPAKVDVNVHPAKLEVRFQEENAVFKAVYHAIKDALLKAELVANTDHTSSEKREESGLFGNRIAENSNISTNTTNNAETIVEQIYKARQMKETTQVVGQNGDQGFDHNMAKMEDKIEMPEIEKSQEVLRKLQEMKQRLIQETPVLKEKLEAAEETTTYNLETETTETSTSNMENPSTDELPKALQETQELKVDLLEEIAKASQEPIDLKAEISKALEKPDENTDNNEKIENNKNVQPSEYSKEFEEMYLKLFGTKPVRGNNGEEQKEDDKQDADDIATLGNTSVFDNLEEYQRPNYKFIGIVFNTYIIIEIDKEMYIIDQHAAHERILYEKVKANYYNDENKDSQLMLLPDIITLSHKEMEIARDNMQMFRKAGFMVEEFGENTIKLTGVPEMCLDLETKEMFLETLDEINSVSRTAKQEVEERFIATVACKAAVKANMALNKEEVDSLMKELLELPNPFTCPHGRPTAIKMSKYDIERKFARK